MTDDTRHDSTDDESTTDGGATAADTYGLLVVDQGSAAVGRLVDGRVEVVATHDGQITGSARAGGGDPDRFARERDRQIREFYREVAAAAEDAFPDRGGTGASPETGDAVAGIAVGGPEAATRRFVDDHLDSRLADRLLGTYSVTAASERGLRALVDAAADELLDADQRAVRDRLTEFFERLRDDDRVAYGADAVERAAANDAVDVALVASTVDPERREAVESAVAGQDGQTLVVPGHSERGARFAETFGVGALLRFPAE